MMSREQFDEAVWRVAAGAVALVFAAVMLGNLIYGWQTGKFIGLATAAGISLLGGYLALIIGGATWAWRVPMGLLLVGCFLYTQIAGWRVMGVTMADAAVSRSTQATGLQVAADALAAKRAERKALGVVRPLASVEAAEKLECAKVSPRYPDGVGPACTDLRKELGGVRRALVLDREIADAAEKLGGQAQVADGTPDLDAVAKALSLFWPGTNASHVGEWMPKFFVLFFDLVAYLGPMVLGLHSAHGGTGGGGAGRVGDVDGSPSPYWRNDPQGPGGGGVRAATSFAALPAPDGQQRVSLPGGRGEAAGGHSTINLTLGYPALPAPAVSGSPTAPASDAADGAAASGASRTLIKRVRRDLPALDAGAPVDRSVVGEIGEAERPAADVLLGFSRACIVDAPGGLVDVVHLYNRYRRWAGERALAEPAFQDLLGRATGIEVLSIGGHLHAVGVGLRAPGAALKEVA